MELETCYKNLFSCVFSCHYDKENPFLGIFLQCPLFLSPFVDKRDEDNSLRRNHPLQP